MCKIDNYKISVYFVTIIVFSVILNIVTTNLQHENENKQMTTYAFDLQKIKSKTVFLCFDSTYSLIVAVVFVIFVFHHYKL